MRKILSLLCAGVLLSSCGVEAESPVANPKAVVVCGNARFTVLTDRMVRLEWSETGQFEDRASLMAINRRLEVPAYKKTMEDGILRISTDCLTLEYSGGDAFSKDNLKITFGDSQVWTPGTEDTGNLRGTTRTLDGCRGFGKPSADKTELDKGILSRDGWTLLDESGRPLFEPDDSHWENLIVENPLPDRTDWYFMAYGHDYKAALSDYTKVAGKVPLPPKYAFGYWWSRYWAYTDEQLLDIASDIRSYEIPADVFIIDMGWHKYWPELQDKYDDGRDEFGQRIYWTGYSWNRDLIKDPEDLLGRLHDKGFKTALNLHPASGIRPFEDMYQDFRKDYLSRTQDYDGPKDFVYPEEGYVFAGNDSPEGKAGEYAPVPFRLEQKAWADAYFGSVLHPIAGQGVDFWWIDWQQWLSSKYSPSIENTFLCNYMFWQDKAQNAERRPVIYHRWGGLGSHRYQLGFSGDTYETWDVLKYIPYFTATASNVCYGYWGHDIGGHMQQRGSTTPTDPELYTRWMQGAVFTPIFKTHSTESKYVERKIWEFPTHFKYLREAIRLRYELGAYIYGAARETYDSGVCICRPLYYEYPEEENAYSLNEEYFFGPDILATMICQPADPATGLSSRTMWFPAGNDWYDMAAHCVRKGGSSMTLQYSIDQNPWYVKSGAIIPLAPAGIENLQGGGSDLRLLVVPGEEGCCSVYEDDGTTNKYDTQYATTPVSRQGNVMTIDARKGSYDGAASERSISLVLEGRTEAPSAVLVDGKQVDFTVRPTPAVSTQAVEITLPAMPASRKAVITIL